MPILPEARICNIVPRGFGKSTLEKAGILYSIYFGERGYPFFVAWICETQDQALDHTRYIKLHVEENQMLEYYFGKMRGDAAGKRWGEKDFVTAKGDRIIAKGTGQRLRGKAEGLENVRYKLIVLDDCEGQENTKTKERRKANKEWIGGTVFPALDESKGREGAIWLSGTIVHHASYLQGILDSKKQADKEGRKISWLVNFHRATMDGKLDNDSEPIWPDKFPLERLRFKRQAYVDDGMPHMFYQEYMNDARDRSEAPIRVEKINYYAGNFVAKNGFAYVLVDTVITPSGDPMPEIEGKAIPVHVFAGADVAWTARDSSDYQSSSVLGIDCYGNRYLLDFYKEHIQPYDFAEILVQKAKDFQPMKRFSIETVAGGEVVRDLAERFSWDERKLMPGIMQGIRPPPGIDKIDKLCQGLGSFVNPGKFFIKREHYPIYEEMDQMPNPKNDDGMDGLYAADYYARKNRPRSKPIDQDAFDEIQDNEPRKRIKKKRYNWFTGAKK